MTTVEIALLALVVVLVVVVAWYLSYTAARLHRLQTRVEGALAALDAHLVRRAEAAIELANSGVLDPASALVVASSARESLDIEDTFTVPTWEEGALAEREMIESALTEALRLAVGDATSREADLGQPGGWPGDDVEPLRRLLDAHRRARLARRFYNDAVVDVRRVRRKSAVRLFRLAGHAALPRTVEFDDDLTTPPLS